MRFKNFLKAYDTNPFGTLMHRFMRAEAEAKKKLQNKNLSEEEREKLQEELRQAINDQMGLSST